MKTAYQYIRISDEDQSNFSLSGQDTTNGDFAEKHKIKIVKQFVDDGYSAKNFNRPGWKELELALSKGKNRIDYLIVMKYDRLIRNAAQGLAFIEKLEEKWNIKLLSVMENFFIDPHSPYFFKMRADLLVNAEFERRVISDRSKFGVWAAKNQGRFIGVAPFGYNNARDEGDKPIIVVNQEESPVVKQMYYDFLENTPPSLIMQKVKERGFNLKGHGKLQRVLTNHAYAGLIVTPAYKEYGSKIIKATHEGLVPEDVFWRVYYKIKDNIHPQGPKIVDDNIPLRGFILCQTCGGLHTGGRSKGRSQYYYYYRCKKCKQENYSAPTVHNEIGLILKNLSLEEKYVKALKVEAEINLERNLKDRNYRLEKVSSEYESINEKLTALEEKYITNKIAQETYDKWYPVFSRERNGKTDEMSKLKRDDSKTMELYNTVLPHLTDLSWIYKEAEVEDKQSFLKGIFWGGFTKEKVGGRTALLNPMFYENSLKIKDLLRVEKVGKLDITSSFPLCTREGT